jgi:hypothetical protein
VPREPVISPVPFFCKPEFKKALQERKALVKTRAERRAAPKKTERPVLSGYILQQPAEFNQLKKLVGAPTKATVNQVTSDLDTSGGDRRAVGNRAVKLIDADITVADVTFQWKELNVPKVATTASLASAGALAVGASLALGTCGLAIPAVAGLALVGASAIGAKYLYKRVAALRADYRIQRELMTTYVPHMLTNALLEYKSGMPVSDTIDQKLLRQGCLPIPDDCVLQLQRGTAIASQAVNCPGNSIQGFRGVHLTLRRRTALHF